MPNKHDKECRKNKMGCGLNPPHVCDNCVPCTCYRQGDIVFTADKMFVNGEMVREYKKSYPPTREKQCKCGIRVASPFSEIVCSHYPFCTDELPPQEKQDWESRLIQLYDYNDKDGNPPPSWVTDFIRTLRQESKEEGRREGYREFMEKRVSEYLDEQKQSARLEVIAQVKEWARSDDHGLISQEDRSGYFEALEDLVMFLASLKTNSK